MPIVKKPAWRNRKSGSILGVEDIVTHLETDELFVIKELVLPKGKDEDGWVRAVPHAAQRTALVRSYHPNDFGMYYGR